jgi:hypothetical protein
MDTPVRTIINMNAQGTHRFDKNLWIGEGVTMIWFVAFR